MWGEAANVRFMPECLCYIYHNVRQFLILLYQVEIVRTMHVTCDIVFQLASELHDMLGKENEKKHAKENQNKQAKKDENKEPKEDENREANVDETKLTEEKNRQAKEESMPSCPVDKENFLKTVIKPMYSVISKVF